MSEVLHSLDLKKLLKDCLGGGDSSAAPKQLPKPLQELIRVNRLEGLVYANSTYEVPEVWNERYRQRQLHGQHLLKVAHKFSGALEAAGVKCISLRGPADAVWLYGDVAARSFSDIDLYIPRERVQEAWASAEKFGFTLYHEFMPRGFYVRNHLNWALVQKEMDVMCDLHWAIDHPFQRLCVDYGGVFERSVVRELEGKPLRMPCAEDWFLLTAQHFLKHAPELSVWVKNENPLTSIGDQYLLKYVMDLSFFVTREKDMDWKRLEKRAVAWGGEEAFYGSILLVQLLVEEVLPVEIVSNARCYFNERQSEVIPQPGFFVAFLNRFSRKHGLKFDRIDHLLHYCWSPAHSDEQVISRMGRLCVTLPRLGLAGLDTMLCFGFAYLKKGMLNLFTKSPASMKEVEVQHG